MPNKIRIYNSTYNEIFPIPEGKEEELIARAKKYKMNYEIISSKPIQQNNTQQAVPVKPIAQQSNSENKNNSNQIDLNEIDSDTLISNYNEGVEQAKQMRGQNKEELKREIYNNKREKDYQDRKKQSAINELKSGQVTENIKLATSPTYDAFGRDIATEEQLKAKEQLNKNQGVILSNSFLRPDKDGNIPSNINTSNSGSGNKQRVEMPQMDVDAEGNIQPYGWGEDNTDINKKIIQGREYNKQIAEDRKQEQIQNIEYNTQLAELSNDKEKESLRYKILPDINNLASTELQGLDALTNQGKLSPFARNYLSNQISRSARKMQENGLNAFDAINRDNIEGITTLGWISVVRNGVNAHFLNSLGEASPEDKDSYMQAMDLISSADNSTSTSNVGYDMLNAVMQSLPYMGEYALTGGIGALSKEATKSVTKNVAKGLIKSGINKKAAIKVGQYLGADAPKLMAFSVASPFAYQHAQEKAIERVGKDFKLEDIKVSDILEGYAKSAIEYAVEGSGGLMKLGIDKVVGNGRVGSFFSYLKNKTPEQIREIYKATKFNGVGYQFAEEFNQNIIDTMVWDEMTWEEVFDPYNNFITLATCAMIQSPATVIQTGSYIKDKYKIHQDLGVVAADDRLVAKDLKRAMSISDQSKRYEAVLNSGISNLKSVKAQKSAIDYVFRSEKMQFQKQVIDEERINTARREVIPIVAGLSYNNSIATVESNEGDKYFIVGETNQDTRLVPVRKIVTEKDANGNEFNRIEEVKRLVDFDKLDASTYIATPYDEYVNRLVDSKLGNTRLQEQQQEIKAEELGMAVEQQTEAATMLDFLSIQEVQTQSEELGIEDKEIRAGSVVTIIGDSNEGNKRNFNVIDTDGINAVIEDNESGLQHTLPLSVLNVEYQLIDKNEKEIKAVENAINGVETAPEGETLQVNTELQTLPTQEETILQEKQQDIYADFPRDKNGEIDVDKLSVEQQLTYAENEVGKDFAVNQATQVKNNLLKQIDSLNKKMPSMSLAKAVQVKKDIAKLEEEVGIYDIYINENSESPQQEEENLNLENKTYSERLSFLEEFAQNDPRAYVLYGIAAGRIKFIWGGERGLAAELGFIRKNNQGEKKGIASELRARISILSNKGYTADTLGEELAEEFSNIDALQGRDIVIETLSEVNSKKDALLALESSYIKFNPEKDINYIAQLEQEEKAGQEAVAYENDIINAYWKYELQNLDEKHKQIAIFAEKIGVPSDLIQGTQSTYDLITLIEEYNGKNNNTTGNNGSNGVSQSEGTQITGVEQAIREGESHRGGESEDSNSYQSSKENGLSNIQDEQTRNEVSDDTDKRGNNSEGYGKEQSNNANQILGEQRPQEIGDVSGSSNEEGNNVEKESNLSNGDDAIRSEEVYKGGISNTETGESTTSTNEDASQGDSQMGKSSLENQVKSIINKFIEDNNFKFKDVRVISKDSDEYRKKAGYKNVTGWYLPITNEVVIVYDNLGEDVENEVKKTYLHEILGHKTIREALRKEDYVPLMQLIYDAIPAFYKAEISKNQGKDVRNTVELELSDKGITDKATIEQEYQKRLDEIVANRIEREQAQYKDKIEYADEFLAVFTENYDNLTPESKKTLIDIIKDFFKRVFGVDAEDKFFEDLVKLSYEIARGEKTAQGKINKLNSMLNSPDVTELSKEELKVDTNPTERQKETGIESWYRIFEEAKEKEDLHGIRELYSKVRVTINGIAPKYGDKVKKEFENLKAEIEAYAEAYKEGERKEKFDELVEELDRDNQEALEFNHSPEELNEIAENDAKVNTKLNQQKNVPEGKIEDYGEKIGGARKDIAKEITEKINNITNDDIMSLPLSKILPKPNFVTLEKEGLNRDLIILLSFIYDNLPTKPKKYGITSYISSVNNAINTIKYIMNDFSIDKVNEVVDRLNKASNNRLTYYKAELEALGFPNTSLKRGDFLIKEFKSKGEPTIYSVVKKYAIIRDYDTLEEAQKGYREIVESRQGEEKTESKQEYNVYKRRSDRRFFITPKGKSKIIIQDGFTSAEEAFAYIKENKDALDEKFSRLKHIPTERNEENRERVGIDWTKGKNITNQEFADTFGFRAIEYGNWVNQTERQDNLNNAYNALMDLADVIGVSPKALSLSGELALAFGSRGKSKAMAHYEPDKIVINLTKKKGAGSLAHEWFHALDNYFSRQREQKNLYITDRPRRLINNGANDNTRQELLDAFEELTKIIDLSDYKKRSDKIDSLNSKKYWGTTIELAARAFENYVIDKLGQKNIVNDYLANFKSMSEYLMDIDGDIERLNTFYPYPMEEEAKEFNERFDDLFNTIQEKVENDNVVLFRQSNKDILFREKQIKSESIAKGTFMKAPNGKPSNLTEKQWLQVRTPEFKAWFGDWENDPKNASKVIDENGEPLIVYHGTGEDFNIFNKNKSLRGNNIFGTYYEVESDAFFFTNNKYYAEKVANIRANHVREIKEVYLKSNYLAEIEDFSDIEEYTNKTEDEHIDNELEIWQYLDDTDFVKKFKKEYDGAKFYESDGKIDGDTYAVFSPNQIKSATDNNGEFNSEENDIRFREVPTNKNFVALHNIPEWKLARVLKQGGFVNPSIAVTIPEIAPFESYGEISFIAPKRLIDKKTGKNAGTFLGDAYTPRYPHVEYDISSRNIGKLNDRIYKNEILKKYNLSSFVSSRILSDVREKGIDEIQLSLAVKLLFLAERGIDTIQVEKRKYSDNELKELKDLDFANKEIFGIKDSKEDKEVLTKLWESKNKDKYEDFEDAKQKLYEDGNVPILIMRDMLTEIKSEINSPVRVNFSDNLSHANRYIIDNNLNQEAEKFAYDLYNSLDVKEQIFDGFTPTGRRRYLANTIQNASKLMKKDGLEGAEGWNHGLGSLRALVVPKLTSTDKLSKFRSLIVSEDEFETIKVDLEDVYDNISNELRGENGGWDTGNYRLSEVINLSNPSEYLKKEYDLEISDELNNQIKELRTQLLSMPTEYFETKFQRPVYVSEFSGVLIPSNTSEEVKDALSKTGIKVKEYIEDSERQTKLNELIDDLETSEQIRFRENKQFQEEQRNIQKISNKTYDNFNLNEEIRFRMGNKARANYDDILKTKRTDLSKEGRDTFLDYLDGIDDKKKEKVTFNWFAKGTIIVPEDMYKVEQAIKVADIKKIDPMQFNSPMEIIDKFSDVEIKSDRINPDKVKTLSNKVDYGNGITVYNVAESEQGRKDMREIINTHFGKKSSPWCLLQGDENGELTSQSKGYWKQYNKIPKRVAFLNGKLLAFSANSNSDIIWWDKTDNSYEGIPITRRIPNDELKRTGTMLFNEETKQLGKYFNMFKGDKVNGLYENWYDNGQLREHVNYKDGKRDGLYEWWNMDGQLKERYNYKDGELYGLYEWWNNDGQLKERLNYKDGKINGLYEMWNGSGQLKKRGNYTNMKKDGLHEEWYDNGQPKERSNHKDGNKDGLYEYWDKDGQLRVRSNYKDGMLNGLSETFDENGKLRYSVIYSNDVPIKDNLKEDENVRYRLREKPAPKNTIKAYKLFRTDNKGNLYTLFIDNNVPLKIGSWYDADSPQMDVLSKLPHTKGEKEIYLINKDNTFELWSGNTKLPNINEVNNASISQARYIQVSDGKNRRMYHNVGINGANGVSLFAMRAGLHSTNVPSAHHIGKGRAGAKAVYRPDNQVWAEIEVSADVNYQDEALSNAPIVTSKSSANYGKPNMAMAQITDKIPIDGYYIYQTNTNANKAQDWIISGAMKINKVLDDNTTKKIARDLGFDEDLPRVQEKINRFNELLNGESNNRYRTINIDGKERPTVNSLGKPIASTEEGLRNFWKWFGDSKVVDSEGLPLVVYHGTDTEFNVFTKKDIGFHFGTEKQANSRLSTLVNNRVKFDGLNRTEVKSKTRKLPVYLKIENILETKDYGNWHNPQSVLEKLVAENIITKKEAWKVINSFPEDRIYATSKENQEYVTKYLQSKGYDGIKYINKYEAKKEKAYSYIVFESNQIKSIDNVGTFDPENEDIRFRWKDVSNDSEIDKYKNRYNGKKFEIEDDKILITKYSVIEDSPTNMYAIEDTYSFKDALYTAQGYNADADNDYTRVIIRANSGYIPLVEFKEYTKENSADFEEYDGTIDDYVEQYLEDYLRYNDIEEDGSGETLDIQESEYDNTETDDLIEEVKEKIYDRLGVSVRKYSNFYVNRDGKITEDYEDEQGNENIEVTMRLADHTHNPSNGSNDLNIVIADNDKTGSRFWYARTDMEFDSTYTADEIVDEIEDYWREFASENYDSEEIRFRTKDKSKAKIERFNALLNEEYEDEKEKKSRKERAEEKVRQLHIDTLNKFKPLKDIHEKLIKDGAYIPFNIYYQITRVNGSIMGQIDEFKDTLGKALRKSIYKIKKKGGFSYDEIGIYFQAQFMPERTAQLIQKRIEKDFVLNRIDEVIQNFENKKAENLANIVISSEEIKKTNDKIDKSIYKLNKAKEERTEKIRNKLQERGLAGEQGLKELMEKKGFPNVTPEDYIKMFEKEVGDTELINELNRNKKAIVKFTLDTALRTGQISKEQYAEYTSSENYVPLRGWDITFDDSGEDNIFQSVSKSAKGRKSLAANPINYLYAMAYTAVTFGEKNILKNNLATLALWNRSNPNFMDNFGYNTFYSGYLVDEEGNEVPFEVTNEEEFIALEGVIKETLVIRMHKEKYDNLNAQKNPHKYDEEYKKHILTFYDNGIRHELYIEDINLVNAFKSDKMTKEQARMKRLTSYRTKFMTARNPSFIIPNFVKDSMTVLFLNNYFDDAIKDAAFKAQIIKNMGKVGTSVLKGVWKNDWNTDKEIGKIYNEWLLGGGRTGWLQTFKDINAIQKDIEREINNNNKVKKWFSNRWHMKTMESFSEFSESIVRFSVYYTAIQNGFTKEQSIWFSNDASLNFNLKGAKGNWLRAIYGFWNASLAGFYKVGKFTWENKGKAAATFTFFMAAGFGKWWLDQLDDDEEKRSEWKKQRMLTYRGFGIPISYDLLPPFRIGYMLADVIFGDMSNTQFVYETAMSFTELLPEQVQTAFTAIAKYNPKRDKVEWFNGEELWGLTPTFFEPLVETFITNKNFMGQDIMPENKFKDLPNSAKYKDEKVTALDKLFANIINGLDEFDWADFDENSKFTSSGEMRWIDVSPAQINHLVSSYFSGTAQLITGSSDAITMATDDKEDGFNKISGKIPVINRFYIPTNESLPLYKKMEQMQAKYSDLLENHKEITSVLNDKKSTQEKKVAYRKRLQVLKKNPLYNEAMRYKRREDDIRDLRKQLRLANKLGKYEQANELKMKLDKIDREINQ